MKPLALHPFHEKRGAQFGELSGSEVVQRYGDLEREYLAARSKAALLDLSYRDVLRLTGPDHIDFLQGMLTQDVRALADDASTYTALCTAKGAMVADARVLRRSGEVLLETEPSVGARIKSALEKFLISEEVEIADASSDWAILGLRGPSVHQVLKAALGLPVPAAGRLQTAKVAGHEVILVEHSWPSWNGADLWVGRSGAAELAARLFDGGQSAGIEPVGSEIAEIIRVEEGVPRFGKDMTEATIPLEANLEHAISFTKGCYLGQEVIARATYRGHVNKKLTGIIFAQPIEGQALDLSRDDRLVGHVTSTAFSWKTGKFIGLAMVHRDHLTPGTQLDVGKSKGAATVHSLPFV